MSAEGVFYSLTHFLCCFDGSLEADVEGAVSLVASSGTGPVESKSNEFIFLLFMLA